MQQDSRYSTLTVKRSKHPSVGLSVPSFVEDLVSHPMPFSAHQLWWPVFRLNQSSFYTINISKEQNTVTFWNTLSVGKSPLITGKPENRKHFKLILFTNILYSAHLYHYWQILSFSIQDQIRSLGRPKNQKSKLDFAN